MSLRHVLIAATSIAALSASTAAAQEYIARVGHLESDQQPRHRGLSMVADLVNERTGGEVQFQIFPAGQLGQAREMNEGVQLGLIEGTVSPAAFLAGFNPAVSILDVPFLYPTDRARAAELRNGPFGEAVLDSFESVGLVGVALWPNGRKAITSNNAVATTDDFQGQRFRVMDSPVLIEQFNSVGASAISLPFGELYTALQTGVVDGQENALDTIATMRYHEVQTHLAISEHGANEDVVMFNPTWWNNLPEEYRDVIVEAFLEVAPQVEEWKEAAQESALSTISQSSIEIVELDEEQRGELREIMYEPTREAYLAGAPDLAPAIIEVYESEYARIVGE